MKLDLGHLNAKLVLPVDHKRIEFWLVGAGGTGSFMAMNLARMVFELKRTGKQSSLVIVDPDQVEEGNIPRSNFCFAEIGAKKAETLAGRIARAWGIEVGFVNEGFRPQLLESKSDDWSGKSFDSNTLKVLVGCVDNHLARREMHEAVKLSNEKSHHRDTPRLWWIDGGNGRDTGQVLLGNRLDEKEISKTVLNSPILSFLPAPSLQHPELLEPENTNFNFENFARTNCAERIRLGEQSLNINQRVAVEISEILTSLLLTHKLKRFAAYFDLESGASRSVFNTPEAIKAACRKSTNGKTKTKAASNDAEGKHYESIVSTK